MAELTKDERDKIIAIARRYRDAALATGDPGGSQQADWLHGMHMTLWQIGADNIASAVMQMIDTVERGDSQ